MLFLIGVRTKAKAIGQMERACAKCARPTMQTNIQTRKWLTLFFIPVIPLSANDNVVRCNLCGLNVKGATDLKTQSSPKAMAAKA
jgi:hypothetical protein